MAAKRKALGRGLSALIPETTPKPPSAPPAQAGKPAGNELFLCPVERIHRQAGQPRRTFDEAALKQLADSIAQHGVIQPLIVRPREDGNYELIAGERRWRAAQAAGVHDVPVVVRTMDDRETFEAALVENIQREDLNPIEEALSFARMIKEFDYSQAKIAQAVGKDRSTVANALRLLKLPERAQRELVRGTISPGHARALLGLNDGRGMAQVLKRILEGSLSVRDTERLVKRLNEPQTDKTASEPMSANLRDLQERLSRQLATRVQIRHRVDPKSGKAAGRLEIHYNSLDELDRLLQSITGR